MFEQASIVLMRRTEWSDVADALYERDRTINRAEQEVRESIVTHLSVGNTAVFWPLKSIPISLAKGLARVAVRRRVAAVVFLIGVFYLVPLAIIVAIRWFSG